MFNWQYNNLAKMMKVTAALFCFISVSLHAEVKWIPIKPIDSNENNKPNNKLPQTPPSNNLIENVKIIQQLLESTTEKDESSMDSQPNWYPLDNAQNR